MTLYKHQEEGAIEVYELLKKYGLVYMNWEERTGKSLTAIRVAEISTRKNVLILTKKTALTGWNATLKAYKKSDTHFHVINYHALHKAVKKPNGKLTYKLNLDPNDFDLIILDESHNYLSTYPKVGVIWKSTKQMCKGKPIIYLSATSNAQGYQLLYNQLALSDWSPFKKYKNFYRWFGTDADRELEARGGPMTYGIPSKVRTSYGLQETYKKCKDVAWRHVQHLFHSKTRAEVGFEHEPNDIINYYELEDDTKKLYNRCLTTEMFEQGELIFPLDSSMKLRTTLHMLEGGVAKQEDLYYVLDNSEKLEAILKKFGDSERNVIMYHYKAELMKLGAWFNNTILLQGTSYAEGVDLSMYDNLIIYSQDFSTARHSQRRARQANKQRKDPINVHFFLVKGGISEQVYDTVSVNKSNFIDTTFRRETL